MIGLSLSHDHVLLLKGVSHIVLRIPGRRITWRSMSDWREDRVMMIGRNLFADTLSEPSPAFSIRRGIRICDGSSGIAFIVTRGEEMTKEVAGEEEDDAGCSA